MQSEFISGLRSADRVVVLTSHDVIRFSKIQPRSIKIYNPLTIKRGIISSLTNHVISMVSRIDIQQKGLDLLVKIAANIPDDWEIRLAGSGPDENKLRNLISQMNVNNKLRDELLVKEQQSDGTYKTISEDSSELNYPMFPTQMINSNYPLNIQQLPKNLVHLFEHAHLSY